MLTFHSLVDATVSTPAVVHALYGVIADARSELVLFDINRMSGLVPFINRFGAMLLSSLTDASPRRYKRTLITNVEDSSLSVVEKSIGPGATASRGNVWTWRGRATCSRCRTLTRLTCNPFFDYLDDRVAAWIPVVIPVAAGVHRTSAQPGSSAR